MSPPLFVFLSILPVGTGKDVRAVFPRFCFFVGFCPFGAARAFKQGFDQKLFLFQNHRQKGTFPFSLIQRAINISFL